MREKVARPTRGLKRMYRPVLIAFTCALGVTSWMTAANALTCGTVPPTSAGALEFVVDAASACTTGQTESGGLPTPAPGTLLEKLDKDGNHVGGPQTGVLTINYLNQPGTSSIGTPTKWEGEFHIADGYTNLLLAITDGNKTPGPRWAVFTLTSLDGLWSIINGANNLPFNSVSNFGLYGIQAVPLPPALLLFGTALAGVTLLGRRRVRRGSQMTS